MEFIKTHPARIYAVVVAVLALVAHFGTSLPSPLVGVSPSGPPGVDSGTQGTGLPTGILLAVRTRWHSSDSTEKARW